MPQLLAIGLIFGVVATVRGQALSGIVRFANDILSGINAPFYDSDGTTRLSGATFRAALYVGQVGTPPESWVRAGSPQPFRTGPEAGFWVTSNITLPGFPVNSAVSLQVRFWDSVDGAFATYEEAEANGAKVGVSPAMVVVLNGGFPPTPTPMVGLQSASLVPTITITLTRGAPGIVTDAASSPNGTQLTTLCDRLVGTNRWFRFASSVRGEAVLTTVGSSIDTVMSVFQGSIVSPSALTPITCNDDRASNTTASEVRFSVEANKLYLVCVAGKNGTVGPIQLNHILATPLAIRSVQPGWVELSWPADATNFIAESATATLPSPSWATITNTPFTITNRLFLRLNCGPPHQIYRLRLDSRP